MRTRVILQPVQAFSGKTQYIQEARFMAPVDQSRTGVAFVNVYSESVSGTLTVLLETATHKTLPVIPPTGLPFWQNVGVGTMDLTAANLQGVLTIPISNLSRWLRYTLQTPSTSSVELDIIAYLADA